MGCGCEAAVVVCGIMLDEAPGYGCCWYVLLPMMGYVPVRPAFCGGGGG